MIQFILGGARSGKSRLAEQIAQQLGKTVIYVATAQGGDAEMQARIRIIDNSVRRLGSCAKSLCI